MDTAKIKNLIIVILLLLNVFLLISALSDRAESQNAAREALETTRQVLQSRGINLEEALDTYIETPSVYRLRRDMTAEQEKMDRLLGDCGSSDLGGNIWFYSAAGGQASLRGTGELDVLLETGRYPAGSSRLKTVEKVLERLGMEAWPDSVLERDNGGAVVLELDAGWNGCRVYNARMSFTFSANELIMLSGTRLLDQAEDLGSGEVMDLLTVTMRFVEVVEQEGHVCNELRGVDVGYLMSVTVSGESTLTPLWHFSTDTGDIYINALTGKTETIA